ncbi:MAG: IS6 family transposase [Desulfobacter sp.]|nr:IS6 family transposase [Desulfobacter sp.]
MRHARTSSTVLQSSAFFISTIYLCSFQRNRGYHSFCSKRQAFLKLGKWECARRKYLRQSNDSYRIDETYIKVRGKMKYLYRAVDSRGNTIDFLLRSRRNMESAKRFFKKMLRASNSSRPRVLSVDGNPAYPPAVKALKEKKLLNKDCILRQNKYLNNIIEQDHRFIKKLVRAGMGFKTFHSAWRTLKGYEIMNMIRKGQVKNIRKGEILKQKEFVENRGRSKFCVS